MDTEGVIAKKESERKHLAIIIALIAVVFFYLPLIDLGIKAGNADIRADLTSSTMKPSLAPIENECLFRVYGWVYNYGSKDVNVTVHLWLSDGTRGGGLGSNTCEFWLSYYIPLGVIQKNGGRKWLDFTRKFIPFDPTTASFYYDFKLDGLNQPRNLQTAQIP
jgi:hypothetical protein